MIEAVIIKLWYGFLKLTDNSNHHYEIYTKKYFSDEDIIIAQFKWKWISWK